MLLCCVVLCCAVMCCVVFYCIVLYCIVLYCVVLCFHGCCVVLCGIAPILILQACGILDKLDFFFSLTGFTMGGKYRNIPAIIPGIIFILLPFVGEHIFKSAYYCKDVETF